VLPPGSRHAAAWALLGARLLHPLFKESICLAPSERWKIPTVNGEIMGIPLERYWDKYDLELYTYDFITNNHRKYTIKHGRPLGNPWDMEVSS